MVTLHHCKFQNSALSTKMRSMQQTEKNILEPRTYIFESFVWKLCRGDEVTSNDTTRKQFLIKIHFLNIKSYETKCSERTIPAIKQVNPQENAA